MNRLKKYCPFIFIQLYGWLTEGLRLGVLIGKRIILRVLMFRVSKYPTTIQLPITYKCNFDCVMCGMHKQIAKDGFTPDELEAILSDRLFKKVSSVGVNGGEPFLLSNLEDYVTVLFESLPKLKNVYIISNGYFTDAIISKSIKIKKLCESHGAKYTLSISIDGYKEMQDKMRGHVNAFHHAVETCEQIMCNKDKYCDSFGTICTITKVNVDHLAELDTWVKANGIPMSYNIATIHKRIQNEDRYEDFSVFTDEHARLLAQEFFYSKYLETKREDYFALYYYTRTGNRIAKCDHQKKVVTLTPNGMLSYCATFSNELGDARKTSAYNLYFTKENLRYRKKLRNECCRTCSHYSSSLGIKELVTKYAKESMRTKKIFR